MIVIHFSTSFAALIIQNYYNIIFPVIFNILYNIDMKQVNTMIVSLFISIVLNTSSIPLVSSMSFPPSLGDSYCEIWVCVSFQEPPLSDDGSSREVTSLLLQSHCAFISVFG